MTNREVRAAEEAVAAAELALARAQLAAAKARQKAEAPPEPPIDTTVRLEVQYRRSEKAYTYIAFRTAAGHWLVTGKRHADKELTWQDVVDLADKNINGRAHLRILN